MYNAYVTRLKALHKHSNADRLQCATCFESHVIVGLDMNETDLVVFFPTDGQLNQEFAEKNNLLRKNDECGNNVGGFLDPNKRNIRSLKLRGEMSDGLVMPLECLSEYTDITQLKNGDTIDILNGIEICKKYVPVSNTNRVSTKSKTIKTKQRESYPFFEEHIDTTQLQYNLRNFKEGDIVTMTLKMHGTSHRESIAIEKKERTQNFIQKLFKIKPKTDTSWQAVAGSRRCVLKNFDGGYYGTNSFRQKYHDLFSASLHHGETAFLEIVGYMSEETPIMSSCANSKISDKAFTKKFGAVTEFSYGCEKGQNECYVYRMTMTSDEGVVTEYPTWYVKLRCEQMGINFVPILDQFIFTTEEDMMTRVNLILDGEDGTGMVADPIGKTHILEGVVLRIENRAKFTAYKHKNWFFKVLESIVKDEALEPDIEEAEELEVEEA
jgi:hypothetical protein